MTRLTFILIVLVAFSGALSNPASATAAAQSYGTGLDGLAYAGAPGLAGSTEPDPLPGLPRPPDQPNTLFQPAPAATAYGCYNRECPYFEKDPLLDPNCLPQPGWLFDMEVDILGTHVVNNVGAIDPTVLPGAGVNVPMARLDWTVSPRFEAGYRLPSGFGEFDVNYRFLLTQGSGSLPIGSLQGLITTPASLTSHFDLNMGDADYASTETSLSLLGPNGPLMKWRLGLRAGDMLFTSEADEPGAGGARYSIENNFWGIGPHGGVELRSRPDPGHLGWLGKLDTALLFGQTHQRFDMAPPPGGPGGPVDLECWEQAPMISGFLGLDWRPASRPNLDLLFGYTAEYWWNVGRMSDPDIYDGQSAGEVGIQGAALRLEYNY